MSRWEGQEVIVYFHFERFFIVGSIFVAFLCHELFYVLDFVWCPHCNGIIPMALYGSLIEWLERLLVVASPYNSKHRNRFVSNILIYVYQMLDMNLCIHLCPSHLERVIPLHLQPPSVSFLSERLLSNLGWGLIFHLI